MVMASKITEPANVRTPDQTGVGTTNMANLKDDEMQSPDTSLEMHVLPTLTDRRLDAPSRLQLLQVPECSSPAPSTPTTPFESTTDKKDEDLEASRAESDMSSQWGDDENTERGNWSSRLETLLSLLGFTVGLGNMWRFPYLLHRHGGVAFFIPYLILMMLFGLPLAYLELAFGQFASLGPVTIWKCAPLFKGVGYAMVTVSALIAVYYNVILSWALFYLFASMQQELPWATCGNSWNTPSCTNITTEISASFKSRLEVEDVNETLDLSNLDGVYAKRVPSDEYFHHYVLHASKGLSEGLGLPSWQLVLCSITLWLFILLSLIRGVKSSGKVAIFTASFPFLALFVLLGIGLAQDGYQIGLKYFFKPDLDKLLSASVWLDAATQLIYTLGPCIGGLVTLASYSRFHHRCYQDAMVLVVTNTVLSILVGLVVFIHLGYMAYSLDLDVSQVVEEGPGLIFIVVTHALTLLPVPTVWSLLFFLLLVTLGLDSQLFLVETVTTAIIDENPKLWRRRKLYVLALVCTVLFLGGIILTTRSGIFLITIMDTYVGSWPSLVIGVLESVAITWVYGLDKWCEDMEAMLGRKPGKYWQILWKYISPITLIVIFIFAIGDYQFPRYGRYEMPLWANVIGWVLSSLIILSMPAYMVYIFCSGDTSDGGIKKMLQPAEDWGPALEKHRWLMQNNGLKFSEHTDPVLMVQIDSLTDANKYNGIPHGYFMQPSKLRKASLKEFEEKVNAQESRVNNSQFDPDLQKRLLQILKGCFIQYMSEQQSLNNSKANLETSTPYTLSHESLCSIPSPVTRRMQATSSTEKEEELSRNKWSGEASSKRCTFGETRSVVFEPAWNDPHGHGNIKQCMDDDRHVANNCLDGPACQVTADCHPVPYEMHMEVNINTDYDPPTVHCEESSGQDRGGIDNPSYEP